MQRLYAMWTMMDLDLDMQQKAWVERGACGGARMKQACLLSHMTCFSGVKDIKALLPRILRPSNISNSGCTCQLSYAPYLSHPTTHTCLVTCASKMRKSRGWIPRSVVREAFSTCGVTAGVTLELHTIPITSDTKGMKENQESKGEGAARSEETAPIQIFMILYVDSCHTPHTPAAGRSLRWATSLPMSSYSSRRLLPKEGEECTLEEGAGQMR